MWSENNFPPKTGFSPHSVCLSVCLSGKTEVAGIGMVGYIPPGMSSVPAHL